MTERPRRTFDVLVNIDNPAPLIDQDLDHWPAHVQDRLYMAVADKSMELGIPLMIAEARVDQDDGMWFIHLWVVEQRKH